MNCPNCGSETHGGYCDCMIVNGEFKGAWWLKTGKCNCGNETSKKMKFKDSEMWICDKCCEELLEIFE